MSQHSVAWRAFVLGLSQAARFAPPADDEAIRRCELSPGIALPPDLRRLFQETDGVVGIFGQEVIWPVARIDRDNHMFRGNRDFLDLYMPFYPLLFFGEWGNGDQFAFPIQAGAIRNHDVFIWDHETDGRAWFASMSPWLLPCIELYLMALLALLAVEESP